MHFEFNTSHDANVKYEKKKKRNLLDDFLFEQFFFIILSFFFFLILLFFINHTFIYSSPLNIPFINLYFLSI